MQLNIKNWDKFKYSLKLELHNQNPDIVLLNETGKTNLNSLKIHGYKGLGKNNTEFHGAAIFVKYNFHFEIIELDDPTMIAIKLKTSMGTIILSTTYCPPRENSIPIISLNKIFSFNLPTLFIGDLNAHHASLQNMGRRSYADAKGRQVFNLMQRRHLQFLGPFFKTFISRRCTGTPDIILASQSFNIFNHLIEQGNDIGSDHLPIVMKVQVQPFIMVKESGPNIKTLNITNYMKDLRELEIINLENHPKEILDSQTNNLISAIKLATKKNCNPHKIIKIQQYSPTPEITKNMQEYQKLIYNYYRFGNPPYYRALNKLEQTLNLIKEHCSEIWKKLVSLASECYGDPRKFWKKF